MEDEHAQRNSNVMLDDALAQLRDSFDRFCTMPDEIWEEVRKPWQLRSVNRGELLTRQGTTERTFSLIISGVHRLYFTKLDGDEHTVAFAYPPDYSGVPDSFFQQQPSEFSLEALSDGNILAADYHSLSTLMKKFNVLDRWAWQLFLSALSGRLKRERELVTMTAEERYRRLLKESPRIIQLASLKHIASYLGMSPETLSRVRSSLS